MPKIFFATDLHGSETCWRKFINAAKFYDCDTLICGGDMTGKAIVPIVQENGRFTYTLGGEVAGGRVVDIDGFSMISTGWSNPTPWNTYREESEEKLAERIDSMAKLVSDPTRAIFNLHCPPYQSGLDEAPAIDADLKLLHGGRALRPVGSTAVKEAIQRYQPVLSLHGHIHESKGAVKIGKTLSINPGSAYEEGMLMAAIINLDAKKGIKTYQLVNG